jgi:hypothetical protein
MWVFLVAIFAGLSVATASFLITKSRKSIRISYREKKSKKETRDAHIMAKRNMILYLCMTFLGPIPFVFVLINTKGSARYVIIGLVILIIIGSVILFCYWRTVEAVTCSLLKEDLHGGSNSNALMD